MKHKASAKVIFRRMVSALLAFLMCVNVGVIELLADVLPDSEVVYEMSFSGGGDGTAQAPYVLKDASDFVALEYNVANIPNYSFGKHFKVDPVPQNDIKTISMQTIDEKICIGGLGTDSKFWFRGNLNLNQTTVYSDYPLFGTLADGASISSGVFVITGDGSLGEESTVKHAWGGLASYVRGLASAESVSVSNVEIHLDIEETVKTDTSLGGLIGKVCEGSQLNISSVAVSGAGATGMNIDVKRSDIGGFIGKVESGSYVQITTGSVIGMIANSGGSAAIGGFVGRAQKGAEIVFDNRCVVPEYTLMSGGSRAVFVGNAGHALIRTTASFQLIINDGSVTLDEDKDIDNAGSGAVYSQLTFVDMEGTGEEDDPYIIKSVNDLLLLAAAVNTGHWRVLESFGFEKENALEGHEYVKNAYYKVTQNIDMSGSIDAGFNGIGYYSTALDYEAFTGVFYGDPEYKPYITLDINTRSSYKGLFVLVTGTEERAAVIKNLILKGRVVTYGTVVGGAVAQIGIPNSNVNTAGVTVSDIECTAVVAGYGSGNGYIGGLVGRADFSKTSGTSALTLSNNLYGGKLTTYGSYAGGLIGAVISKSQAVKENDLTVDISGFTFDKQASVRSGNASVAHVGGAIGAIVSSGTYTDFSNSSTKPGTGFGIVYNTTKLTAEDILISGTVQATASGAGGFASALTGVEASLKRITLSGTFNAENGLGGIAQTVGGKVQIDGITITKDAKFDINSSTIVYSGIVFGNSINAWVDISNINVDPAVSIKVTGSNDRYADLSAQTFYTNSTTYRNGTVLMGGMLNINSDTTYVPAKVNGAAGTGSNLSRYYYNFSPEKISGKGTAEAPFIIDTVEKLQTLSVFNYLSSATSWMMLEYFPEADYGQYYTDVDKVMYIKLAHFKLSGNLDLTGKTYYPAPIIGGNYVGDNAVITFAATEASTITNSTERENHSGLFTTVSAYSPVVPIEMSGFTFKGTVGGTYYPGALVAGCYIPNNVNIIGLPAIYSGRFNISDITVDGIKSIGGTFKRPDKNDVNGTSALIGYISGGVHNISDIHIKNMATAGEDRADAMIGRVTGSETLLQMTRIEFPTATATTDRFFEIATFISNFGHGSAIYSFDSALDDPKYEYIIEETVLPTDDKDGASNVIINPAVGVLDIGLGTKESPFVIYSAAQLAALALAIQSDGKTLGGMKDDGTAPAGNLAAVNGYDIPATQETDADVKKCSEYVKELAKAHYRLSCDIDFYSAKVMGYNGLGTAKHPFSGVFDGKGYTVTLSAGCIKPTVGDKESAKSNFGLFGYISGAAIRNLIIDTGPRDENAVHVQSTTDDDGISYNGMVAAVMLGGDTVLDNIRVQGVVNVEDASVGKAVYIGGYVGHVEAGTLILINVPENFNKNLFVFSGGAPVSPDDKHFAGICPSVKDGFIVFDGEDPTTGVHISGGSQKSGKVNESLSWILGPATGGVTTKFYYMLSATEAQAENLPCLPEGFGLTLDANSGLLSGVPMKAGEFQFAVRVKSVISYNGEEEDKVVYDTRIYTLNIARAEYPTLVPDSTALVDGVYSISYAKETATLNFSNFPSPDGNAKTMAKSDAVLSYQCVIEGNGVVEIGADNTLRIIGVGETEIIVTKPMDSAYEACEIRMTVRVVPAVLSFIVEEQTWYFGNKDGLQDIYLSISGLRGMEEGKSFEIDAEMKQKLRDELGIAEMTLEVPEELRSENFEPTNPPKPGTYRVTINEAKAETGKEDLYAQTLQNYTFEYRHGIVKIIRKTIAAKDYNVYLKAADGEFGLVAEKSDRLWFNNDFYIAPSNLEIELYDRIRIVTEANKNNFDYNDPNSGWRTELEYTKEMADETIFVQLMSTQRGYVTDSTAFRVMIDKTAPRVVLTYTARIADEPLFSDETQFTDFPKATYGAIYKQNFTVLFEGADSEGTVQSGLKKLEYLFIDAAALTAAELAQDWANMTQKDLEASIDALIAQGKAEWKPANSGATIEITNRMGAYYVRAVDEVGNASPITTYMGYADETARDGWFVADDTKPVIEILNRDQYGEWQTYQNGVPNLIFKIGDVLVGYNDKDIVCEITLPKGENETEAQKFALVPVWNEADGTYSLDLNVDQLISKGADGTYTVTVKVKDKLGNEANAMSVSILKDATRASAKLEAVGDKNSTAADWGTDTVPAKYTQTKTFRVTIEQLGPAGLREDGILVYRKVLGTGGEVETFELAKPEVYVLNKISDGVWDITVSEEGTYTVVIVKNTYLKGDTENTYLQSLEFDITVPKVDSQKLILTVLSELRGEENEWSSIDLNTNRDWQGDHIRFSFTLGQQSVKGTGTLYILLGEAPVYGLENGIPVTEANKTDIYPQKFLLKDSVDANYTFYVVTESGVESNRVTLNPRIDMTPPEIRPNIAVSEANESIRKFLSSLTGELFFNHAKIQVDVSDAHSGIKEVSLALSEAGIDLTDEDGNIITGGTLTTEQLTTVEGSDGLLRATFYINANFKGTFTVIATDAVGNTAEKEFESTILVDRIAPTFDFEFELGEKDQAAGGGSLDVTKPWLYQGIQVHLTGIADPTVDKNDKTVAASGLHDLVWWTSQTEWDVANKTSPFGVEGITPHTVGASELASGSYTLQLPDLDNGAYYLNFAVYDNAGNATFAPSQYIRKDSINASIGSVTLVGFSGEDKLQNDEINHYIIPQNTYAAVGDVLTFVLSKDQVSPQFVNVYKDGTFVTSCPANEDGIATYKLQDGANVDTTYTFVAYAGAVQNGESWSGNINTASETVTLSIEAGQIDPEAPYTPVIDPDTTLEFYENKWVQALTEMFNVEFRLSKGAPEHLEYTFKKVTAGESIESITSAGASFGALSGHTKDTGSVYGVAYDTYKYALTADTLLGENATEGVYVLFFRVADEASQHGPEATLVVRYDKTSPDEAKVSYSVTPYAGQKDKASYVALFGTDVTLTANATDASVDFGGKLTYSYKKVANGTSPENVAWTTIADNGNTVAITENFDGVVYFEVKDEAGNTTLFDTGRILVNKNVPSAPQKDTDITAERLNDTAGIDTWQDSDIIFTFVDLHNNSAIDHYEYFYNGAWHPLTNATDQVLYWYKDGDVYKAKFGIDAVNIAELKFRAVSQTGVTGTEPTWGFDVKMDKLLPEPAATVTGVVNAWTNKAVSFTLGNTAANLAPITYYVYVGDNAYELGASGTVTMGSLQGTWNKDTMTFTIDMNVPAGTLIKFGAQSEARPANTDRGYTEQYKVNIQKSVDHLNPALQKENLDARIDPTGTTIGTPDASNIWYNAWYITGDLPAIVYSNPTDFTAHNETGAPVSVAYKLTNAKGEAVKEGKKSLAEVASYSFFDLHAAGVADGVYTLFVWLCDEAGNTSEAQEVTLRADRTAPTDVTVKHGTTDWTLATGATVSFKHFTNKVTGEKLTVNFNAETDVAKIIKYEYVVLPAATVNGVLNLDNLKELATAENTEWSDATALKTTTLENNFVGRVYLRVTDEAGNVTVVATDGIVIETTQPTVVLTDANSKEDGFEWYGVLPKIYVNAFDLTNEGKTVPMSEILKVEAYEHDASGKVLKGGELQEVNLTPSAEGGLPIYTARSQGEYKITFIVTDKAGNTYTKTVEAIYKVDSAKPTIDISAVAGRDPYTSGAWTNKHVSITLSSTGSLTDITYYYAIIDNGIVVNDETNLTAFTWIPLVGNTWSTELYLEDQYFFNDQICFKAESQSGNAAAKAISIKMQRSISRIDEFKDENGTKIYSFSPTPQAGWLNQSVEASLVAPYRLDAIYEGGTQARPQAALTTHVQVLGGSTAGSTDPVVGLQVIVLNNGQQVGDVYSTDSTGTFSYTAAPGDSFAFKLEGDAYYTVLVRATDEAGNEAPGEMKHLYQIDTTAPTGTVSVKGGDVISPEKQQVSFLDGMLKILTGLTFDTFFESWKTFTVNVNWDISGRAQAQYYKVVVKNREEYNEMLADGVTVPQNAWKSFNGNEFAEEGDFAGFFLVRLTDNAGNVSVISTTGVVIDTHVPSFGDDPLTVKGSLSDRDPNKGVTSKLYDNKTEKFEPAEGVFIPYVGNDWYRSVSVDFKVDDLASGFNKLQIVHIYVDKDGKNTGEEKVKVELDRTALGEDDLPGLRRHFEGTYVTNESGMYKVEIRVFENATPNTATTKQTGVLRVDSIEPKLTVTRVDTGAGKSEIANPTEEEKWWQSSTFTLNCEAGPSAEGQTIFQYKKDTDGTWINIDATDGKYIVDVKKDTNTKYYFRALIGATVSGGTVTNYAWAAFEGEKTASFGEENSDSKAKAHLVQVQVTAPRDFVTMDFATSSECNTKFWYNEKELTVTVQLPCPITSDSAPMTTVYTLTYPGAEAALTGETEADDQKIVFTLSSSAEGQKLREGNFTLTMQTTDYAGNSNTECITTYKNDYSAPIINSVKVDNVALRNLLESITFGQFFRDGVVDIDVNYDVSGRETLEYQLVEVASFDNVGGIAADPEKWTDLGTNETTGNFITQFTISEDFRGLIFVRATDIAGNVSADWISDGMVKDGVAPTVEVSVSSTDHDSEYNATLADGAITPWFKANATLTVSAADVVENLDTLKTLSYTINGGTVQTLYTASDDTITKDVVGNGKQIREIVLQEGEHTVVISAIDRAGNETVVTVTVRVDLTPPVAENIQILVGETNIRADGETDQVMYVKSVTDAQVAVTDLAAISGIAKIEYRLTGDTDYKPTTESDGKYLMTVPAAYSDTIAVKVTDQAGNSTEVSSYRLVVDSAAPDLEVVGNPTTWQSDDVTLDIYAKDNGDAGLTTDALTLSGANFAIVGGAEETRNGATWRHWTVVVNVNSELKFAVTDRAGNSTSEDVTVSFIDKTEPNAPAITDPEKESNIEWTALWFNDTVVVTATFTRTEGSDEWLEYSVNDGEWVKGTVNATTLSCTLDKNTYNGSKPIVRFRVCDLVNDTDNDSIGRVSAITEATIQMDSTAPVLNSDTLSVTAYTQGDDQSIWRDILNAITGGNLFKPVVEVRIETTNADEYSGIKSIYYKLNGITSVDGTPADSSEQLYDTANGFSIPADFSGTITVWAFDNANNKSNEMTTKTIVIDGAQPEAPNVTVVYTGTDTAYKGEWTNRSITFTVSGGVTVSGVHHYEYSTDNGQSWTDIAIDAETGTATLKVAQAADVNYKASYIFRAISNVGNTFHINDGKSSEAVEVKQDTKAPMAPTVTVQANGSTGNVALNKDTWYKNGVLYVTADQDTNGAPITLWYQFENAEWTEVENGQVILPQSGIYKLRFKTVDDAGNETLSVGNGVATTGGWYQVQFDNGEPKLEITSHYDFATREWASEEVVLKVKVSATAPIHSIEVNCGTDSKRYISKNGEYLLKSIQIGENQLDYKLTVTDWTESVENGKNVVTCSFKLPMVDTDELVFTVRAHTKANASDLSESTVTIFGSCDSQTVNYRYDKSRHIKGLTFKVGLFVVTAE